MTSTLPTETLREIVNYDHETGLLSWRKAGRGRKRRVGTPNTCGHLRVEINGTLYYVHRLIWLWVHGTWPLHEIDHLDGDPSNNRLSNLRDVPRAVNAQNAVRAHRDSHTGVLGVTQSANKKRWVASVGTGGGRIKYLGTFDTPELAHAAYLNAKRELHGGNTL